MNFIVGPCGLESLDQIRPLVELCNRWGIVYFRSQIFKPRTHPDSFQGLGERGIPLLEYIIQHGLKPVCEACSVEQLHVIAPYAEVVQIGARNMQNFELLKNVGRIIDFSQGDKKVLLKRGFANTFEEWMAAAEYLIQGGVPKESIFPCERGSRSMCSPTGVCLDFVMVEMAQRMGYKVVIDPSHGSKRNDLVIPLCRVAQGANPWAIMVEIHPRPAESWSDAAQALHPDDFENYLREINCGEREFIKKENVG